MGRKKAHGGDEDGPPVAAAGSTKSKKKALVIDDDEYAIATEPSDDSVPQEEKLVITGKKKGKKGIAKASQSKDDAVEKAAQDGEDEDPPEIVFAGKKKKGGGNSSFSASAFELLGDEDDGDDEKKVEDDDFAAAITFSGKKKKSSKKNNSLDVEAIDEDASAADEAISFSGKKKPSKKKKGHVSFAEDESEATDSVPPQEAAAVEVVVVEASKSKKKKKKSGRTAQEEDDLDMILAELGELPKPASEPVQEKETQPEAAEADEKGGEEESAAAKKKKKKKEKEKEKKAAAKEEKPVEAKTVNTKKLPKHVREMQEALARRKEAEERALKEEEEKRKREEDERLRQEEADRVAEENRRRKKEREKEKLQKKRQEGKLLTAKQKEEARRLEAMRNQILSSSGGLGLPGDTAAPTKRPLYQKKKPKIPPSSSAKLVETVEEKETQPDEADSPEEKSEVAESVEEEEEEVEDEWDAKSWDDVNISVNAFADEEADSESEPVLKKELKKSLSSSGNADKKTASSAPPEDSKKPNKAQVVAVEVTDKNKEKESDETPKGEANLRSPICCIMGHVDTGKTKLLDCIRGTNVQEGEAGGITQQIGATYFPADNIRERTKELKANAILKVPGLLIIDTPGHESFTNLRSRGSGLCDIAVLVVDIMHGLEPQTIESLNLLKMRNTEFIVALNKVDRLYGWKTQRNAPIRNSFKQQSKDVINEFNMRLRQIITQFMEQGINTELYYKNNDLKGTYNIVPTSAITGEGLPDLLLLLVNWTQRTMVEKLTFSNEVQCTVLEVKVVEGHGTTIDVVLVNGVLHEGEQIVVCGMQGPIVTTIRALLTPHPMKELRVKGTYLHHKQIKAAQGIKITAQGLEHAIAGTGLYVVGPKDDVEEIKETTMEDMKSVMSRIDRSGEGVCVQSSTLGSLEALLEFLKTPDVNIPVSGISIGPVHKKDVMKASVMLEKKKEYATILAFDVKVTPDARELAEELGVTIFMADIIYHLFDQFKAYIDNIKEEKKKESAEEAVFPCILEILPNCVFNKKDPIVLGVDVLEGIAKVGTPLCVLAKDGECVDIGRIASIENNHKPVDTAKKGLKVAIKIVGTNSEEQQKMFGRHFEMEDQLVSHISRKSIDLLKANYRDDLSMEEWRLVVKLKTLLKIQ